MKTQKKHSQKFWIITIILVLLLVGAFSLVFQFISARADAAEIAIEHNALIDQGIDPCLINHGWNSDTEGYCLVSLDTAHYYRLVDCSWGKLKIPTNTTEITLLDKWDLWIRSCEDKGISTTRHTIQCNQTLEEIREHGLLCVNKEDLFK